MSGSSLINISYGNRCEAKKSSGRGQQQQACSTGTPSRTPFSPSLGASPELGKKNKHRSPDVRLESPGACVNYNQTSIIQTRGDSEKTLHNWDSG